MCVCVQYVCVCIYSMCVCVCVCTVCVCVCVCTVCVCDCLCVCEVMLNVPHIDSVIHVHIHLNGRKFLVRILRLTTVYTHTHTHTLVHTDMHTQAQTVTLCYLRNVDLITIK